MEIDFNEVREILNNQRNESIKVPQNR